MFPTVAIPAAITNNTKSPLVSTPIKPETTIIQSITEVGSRLLNCFFSYVEKQKDPREILTQHPKNVHQILLELAEAHSPNDSANLDSLATKINTLMKSFWGAYQSTKDATECEQALLSIKLLAKSLKEANPKAESIWKKLTVDVQQIFNKATLLQEEPQTNCLKLRWCHSAVSLPDSPITASFEDNVVFCLKKGTDFAGVMSFSLPKHPTLQLYHTGALPNPSPQQIQSILQNIPSRISEIFDIQPVIQKYSLHRQINQEIAKKYLHQILTMRTSYFSMILEALGIEVLRPKAIGSMGEWSIFSKDTTQHRSLAAIRDWSSEADLLNESAKTITHFLTLEQTLGLKLISLPEDGQDTPLFIQNMFLAIGNKIVPGNPLEKIEFIESNNQNRLAFIKSLLEKHFAPELTKKIEWNKINNTSASDNSCNFLNRLLSLKILSPEDLVPDSPTLITLLRANQTAIQKNPALYKNIPWEKFKDADNLGFYLQLVSLASPELAEPNILLEHSYCLAKKLIIEMPKRVIGKASTSPDKLDYEKLVETFIGDQGTLYTFIITYILSTYQKEARISFKEHIIELLEVESSKQKQKSIYSLLAGRLNDEGSINPSLSPDNWILKGKEKPCSPGEYFGMIFWHGCTERALANLNASSEAGLEDNLAIARTAFICADNAHSKDCAYKQMTDLVHDHMSIVENKRQVRELKESLSSL